MRETPLKAGIYLGKAGVRQYLGAHDQEVRLPLPEGEYSLGFAEVPGYKLEQVEDGDTGQVLQVADPAAIPIYLNSSRSLVAVYRKVAGPVVTPAPAPTTPVPATPPPAAPVGYGTILLRSQPDAGSRSQLPWMEFWLDDQHHSYTYYQHYTNVSPGTHKIRWAEQLTINGHTWLLAGSGDVEVTVAAGEQKVVDAYYSIQLPVTPTPTPVGTGTGTLILETQVDNLLPTGGATRVSCYADVDGVRYPRPGQATNTYRRILTLSAGTHTVQFIVPNQDWTLKSVDPIHVVLATGETKTVVGHYIYNQGTAT